MRDQLIFAIRVAGKEDPAIKVAAAMVGLDDRIPALQVAASALAEEARKWVPGGDLEVRVVTYDDDHVKVVIHQGFVGP